MGRYTGPKKKLSRREGVELHLKGARSFSDKSGLKRKPFCSWTTWESKKGKIVKLWIPIREKQKVKRTYGLREKNMVAAYKESDRRSKIKNTDKGLEFLRLLELRMDNVLYLADLAPSRAAARQYITWSCEVKWT